MVFNRPTRVRQTGAPPAATRRTANPLAPRPPLEPERAEQKANNDIIIAVMGPTGAGKSTLINKILGPGREQTMVGHSLDSCTQEVQAFECTDSKGRRIVLVDSPGFDDTHVSDIDVLQSIADWLKRSYEEGQRLSGLLFLHRISDNRMAGSPLRLLEIFKSICGQDAFKNVVLVTTMWDDFPVNVGETRERELLENDRYWKPMVAVGSRTARSMNTTESAWAIISQFEPESRQPVLLQRELVDLRKPLEETAAGRSFYGWLEGVIATLREILQALRRRLQRARQADPDLQADITQRQEVLNRASRMISRYTYPQDVHQRVYRSRGYTDVNVMPELQERSTTPESEIVAISVQDSDTSAIAFGQENNCAAPPSSPADNLAFDRTNRRALHGSVTALNVIHQLVGSSHIPGLQNVVATILKIAELIEKIDSTHDSLVSLYQNACSMTSGIIEIAQSGVTGPIEAVVDSFIIELTQIKLILGHLLDKGPHMIFLSNQDTMAVDECNRRLLSAYKRIVLPAGVISHGKVRMEDRLDSAITMLRNQSLPNLRRNPTYP